MRRSLFVLALLALGFHARTSPMAFVVLDTGARSSGKLPSSWQVKVNHGRPDISVCDEPGGACLHLKSVNASFSLERGVDVDPAQMPWLTWRWKVTQLPAGGDFRRAATDDQAAQVLVAFADRRIVSYIWDSTAPKGFGQNASFIPLVHVFAVVCESGAAALNQWTAESHNLAADYEHAFGKTAPHVKGVRIQINSQHTGATAESFFGEVAFRGSPQ